MSPSRSRLMVLLPALAAAVVLVLWLSSTRGDGGASGAITSKRMAANPECSTVKGGLESLRSAVAAASRGSVICLVDGVYDRLELAAAETSPPVTVRAENPGKATIAGATLGRSRLTLAHFQITDGVDVEPGTVGVVVDHNRIDGGYLGVDAGPTTTTTVNDVSITGNRFVGPFGEDAIRLNRYHDANGDGIGALVEGNEFTNIRENGNHSDCLQTVWVGDHLVYRRNYLHDNRCQGFFVKDQERPIVGIVVADNLFLRNNAACAPGASGCGQPSDFQVFGPYVGFKMRRNTIWGNGAIAAFQEGTGPRSQIRSNVIYKFWTSTNLTSIAFSDNTRCQRQSSGGGSWPAPVSGEIVDCDPPFTAPRLDDYRLENDRGVTWAPADQHYGP